MQAYKAVSLQTAQVSAVQAGQPCHHQDDSRWLAQQCTLLPTLQLKRVYLVMPEAQLIRHVILQLQGGDFHTVRNTPIGQHKCACEASRSREQLVVMIQKLVKALSRNEMNRRLSMPKLEHGSMYTSILQKMRIKLQHLSRTSVPVENQQVGALVGACTCATCRTPDNSKLDSWELGTLQLQFDQLDVMFERSS